MLESDGAEFVLESALSARIWKKKKKKNLCIMGFIIFLSCERNIITFFFFLPYCVWCMEQVVDI